MYTPDTTPTNAATKKSSRVPVRRVTIDVPTPGSLLVDVAPRSIAIVLYLEADDDLGLVRFVVLVVVAIVLVVVIMVHTSRFTRNGELR